MEEIEEGDRVRCKICFGAERTEQNVTVLQIDGLRCQVKLNGGNFYSLKRIDIIEKQDKNEIVLEILRDL